MESVGRGFVGLVLCFALVVGAARDAWASGFATQHFGGEQGSVVATNPTALYYNPAGIGFSEGIHLYADGDIALRHATWNHVAPQPGGSDSPDSQAGNTGTAHLFNVFVGPAMAATMKIGNLAFGAGFFVPFGGRVNWSKNDNSNPAYPLTADGVQRWHNISTSIAVIHVAAGAAYKLGPLSIGATGNFINSQLIETQARALNGTLDSTQEARTRLDVGDNNGSFAVGAMLEAVRDRLWIGGSYQAQPGLGPQTLKGTFTISSGPAPFYRQDPALTRTVDFHQSLPDIVRGGIRLRPIHNVELRLFGDYTRWSKMTYQCINYSQYGDACLVKTDGSDATPNNSVVDNIPRNWKDTYGGHLGGSYWLNPEIEVFAGAGYETGASPDATIEPGSMDGNNVQMALGGRFLVERTLYFAISYTQLQFLDRNVTASQLQVVNGKSVQPPTFQQDASGQYTQWVGVVDVNIEAKF